MTPFELETHREGDIARLSLFGEFDIAAAPRVDEALAVVEEERPERVVIDLRGLTFIDSTGLRSLLGAEARAREEGRPLTLIQGPEAVQRVFEITGLAGRLDIVEDEASATSGAG